MICVWWLWQYTVCVCVFLHHFEVMHDASWIAVLELRHWHLDELHLIVFEKAHILINLPQRHSHLHLLIKLIVFLKVLHPTDKHLLILLG